MSDSLLSRRQLHEALEHLAGRLRRRGVEAEVYVFGGGAMVLGHDAREATMDLDAAIRQGHGAVTAEARVVARELGLPGWWLNEQATAYLPAASDDEARVVLAMAGLTGKTAPDAPRASVTWRVARNWANTSLLISEWDQMLRVPVG